MSHATRRWRPFRPNERRAIESNRNRLLFQTGKERGSLAAASLRAGLTSELTTLLSHGVCLVLAADSRRRLPAQHGSGAQDGVYEGTTQKHRALRIRYVRTARREEDAPGTAT
ncbi:MAG: hypothetical protein BJ554DRAFT_257 [Olpidium bornovanus]|uniref:Uncharacterized protein n=1 Tax=Olpidium bornovanus TaxID=278681 RepID=A0A8H8DIB5_9FUNG|nr:MAG: hypothetical protein BJ554DRAFT_257 [Olpidium bornovanus]